MTIGKTFYDLNRDDLADSLRRMAKRMGGIRESLLATADALKLVQKELFSTRIVGDIGHATVNLRRKDTPNSSLQKIVSIEPDEAEVRVILRPAQLSAQSGNDHQEHVVRGRVDLHAILEQLLRSLFESAS